MTLSVDSSAAVLRVGARGLSSKNEMLLRSVVRIIRTQTHRVWEFVDDPPYDALIVGNDGVDAPVPPDALAESPAIIPLQPPIDPWNLTRQLDVVGSGASADAVVPRATESTRDLYSIVRMLQEPRRAPYVIEAAGRPLLIVEAGARMWRAMKLEDGSEPAVRAIVARLAQGPVRYPEPSPDDHARPLGRPLPLDVLLWHLGLIMSPGALLPIVRARGTLKLARWPDFGRIGADHAHMKMSAKLTSRAYDIEDLFQALAEPRDRIFAFLNACGVCGLFADAGDHRAAAQRPRTSVQAGRPVGLMQRLRGALGIGRA